MASHSTLREPGKRLGQMLLDEGVITEGQLQEALRHQERTGGVIGRILVDLQFVKETTLISFLVKQCKIPHISLSNYEIDPDLISLVPRDVCLQHALVPIDHLGNILTVAMTDPLDVEALEEVRALCPNLRIKPILCSWNQYEQVVRRLFPEETVPEAVEMSVDSFGLPPAARHAKPATPSGNSTARPSSAVRSGSRSPAPGSSDPSSEAFVAVIDDKVRLAVQRAIVDIGDHVSAHLAQTSRLPLSTADLVHAVEAAMRTALDDAVGVLLFQVQNALEQHGSTVAQISPHQLSELLRSSMRRALQDVSPELLAEAAVALTRRTK